MPVPKWLSRLWLVAVGVSFVIVVPLFAIVWAQRVGWVNLLITVAILFGVGFYRRLPSVGRRRDP